MLTPGSLGRWAHFASRQLSAEHRRWILVNAVAITAVINLLVNAGIARLSAIGRTEIPLWAPPIVGGPSTTVDTVGTLFLLPFITYLLVTAAVGRDLNSGALPRLPSSERLPQLAEPLPRQTALRAVASGAMCVAALAPVAVLIATDFGQLSVGEFVLYKAMLGVALGALVTPAIALRAMADPPTPSPRRPSSLSDPTNNAAPQTTRPEHGKPSHESRAQTRTLLSGKREPPTRHRI